MGAEEEGLAEGEVRVGDGGVDAFEQGDQVLDRESGGVFGVVAAEGVEVGRDSEKGKPAAQGKIYEGDGTVGGVHRAEETNIAGDAEGLSAREGDFPVTVFQQHHQFPKHTGEVGAVDFVNDQDTESGASTGTGAEVEEASGGEGEGEEGKRGRGDEGKFRGVPRSSYEVRGGWGTVGTGRTLGELRELGGICNRSQADDEIFVSIRGVELDEFGEAVGAADQVAGEVFGEVGFAGAGRAVENGLFTAFEGAEEPGEGGFVKAGGVGDRGEGKGRGTCRNWKDFGGIWFEVGFEGGEGVVLHGEEEEGEQAGEGVGNPLGQRGRGELENFIGRDQERGAEAVAGGVVQKFEERVFGLFSRLTEPYLGGEGIRQLGG